MPRVGLTKEKVVEAAAEIIEEHGLQGFSMRLLADSLNIKTASLYNHVGGLEELITEVCIYALKLQRDFEMGAIAEPEESDPYDGKAIMALALVYRDFARKHRELYRLIMSRAAECGERVEGVSELIVGPFIRVLERTELSFEDRTHWHRFLRGVVHGFVSQEEAGFFKHTPVSADESFRVAIRCYIDGLKRTAGRG